MQIKHQVHVTHRHSFNSTKLFKSWSKDWFPHAPTFSRLFPTLEDINSYCRYCHLVTQSCPTLCNPMDSHSPPGSTLHGISPAGILEWVAINSSRGFTTQGWNPCLLRRQADSLPLSHQGGPYISWACVLCHAWLSATPQTVACQAPPSMECSQQVTIEWVVICYSRESFWPRGRTHVPWVGRSVL